jgi:hypothetical protein
VDRRQGAPGVAVPTVRRVGDDVNKTNNTKGSAMASELSDGGRGIVFEVTEEIINHAVARSSGHCVIADAIRASVPDASYVSVDLQTIRFTDRARGKRYIYLTPAYAQRVLVDFDQGVKPAPFIGKLARPAQIVKVNQSRRADAKTRGLPADLKKRVAKADGPGVVPTVIGGPYPPTAALSSTRGRRRAFGLRSLKP